MKVKPVWNNAVSVVLFVLVVTVRSAVLRDDPPSSGEAREGRKLLYGTYAGFYYDDYDGLYSDEDGTDVLASTAETAQPTTLEAVKERGFVRVGNVGTTLGFGMQQGDEWSGFDIELGRALAAAIFGDTTKLSVVKTTNANRFVDLKAGKYDVLSSTSTWTSGRDRELRLTFCGVNFYTGQDFLVNRALVSPAGDKLRVSDLDGHKIGVMAGTTTEEQLATYFDRRGLTYTKYAATDELELFDALKNGLVAAISSDESGLIPWLKANGQGGGEGAWVLVREQISREPLAPVVVEGDPQWEDIVRWTLMGMINAEWLGISSKNVEGMRQDCQTKGCDPAVSFLLGTTPGVGNGFGLEDSWVYNIIKSVGNYAETYEKNLAGHGFERGMNALTENGGLLYSMPLKPFY